MDSYSARANTIFCTFVTVLGTMATLNHLTTFLPQFTPSPTGEVALNKVHDLTYNTYLNMDQCALSFDIKHDLSSEFNWNMNQLFVYIVATYNSTSNSRNEVTLWDRIAADETEALLSMKQLSVEYLLRDQYNELRGRNIRLHIRYRTMPITGIMWTKELATVDFVASNKYFHDGTRSEKPQRRSRSSSK
mmetsp:Transcript_92249/g.261151  ORF Transcript_92249/g.261151 Transcript_92249/m.261151 type:complete len:190 (-) Transcript_92249:106-675(-)